MQKSFIEVLEKCETQDQVELRFMKVAYLLKIEPDKLYQQIKKEISFELDQKLKLFWS